MEDLLKYEKEFLIKHNSTKKYEQLKLQMNNLSKNDILWTLYNDLLLSYQSKKDYFNCFLLYQQMAEQLDNEKKYKQALEFFILALYIRICEIYEECVETGFDSNMMYERHISKFHKNLSKYMKHANVEISDTDVMCEFVRKIIDDYLPQLAEQTKIYWLSFKYIGKL